MWEEKGAGGRRETENAEAIVQADVALRHEDSNCNRVSPCDSDNVSTEDSFLLRERPLEILLFKSNHLYFNLCQSSVNFSASHFAFISTFPMNFLKVS